MRWRFTRPRSRRPGPPSEYALLPWLLLGLGSFSNLVQGETPNPWIGGLGLLVFNSLYISVVFRAFDRKARGSRATRWSLVALGVTTLALGAGYGGNWLLFFPLFGLACGSVMRGRNLVRVGVPLSATAAAVSAYHDGWGAISIAYGTFISMMVTAAILTLSETVAELHDTRQELARSAVEGERLRFSRDLHDLLGHTLSVIVVKAQAARRLAPRDADASLAQVTDIESIGRQALTEIREAVTGYREGSLVADLDRARSALSAAGIEPVVRRSGPPPGPRAEALFGWVVREAVTNAVRHSSATRCVITVECAPDHARVTVTDDGVGVRSAAPAAPASLASPDSPASPDSLASPASQAPRASWGGTGLTGLTERLAAAGGSLTTSPAAPPADGGFRVTATLPVDAAR
ncbi:sensor histidine kinase [Streptomyces corynorhini]|uniref:Sensor histidine kinase n=1 Tax=Streptomyces corynorhini TaxID=2282652 RepID=A0A370AXX7_9ACTN|nr:sensor histidine kinase [Streptomyces corynorhini]RDG34191.1 sensor histidine kinase [Streptomyces corynorhini]